MVSRPKLNRVLFLVAPLLAFGGTLGGSSGVSAGQAVYGVDYWMAPPLVQGSYVTTGAILEDFDRAEAACPTNLAGGISVTGDSGAGSYCNILTPKDFGGALVSTAAATFSGTATNFATTVRSNPSMTFLMPSPQRYLGFWWSAGSQGNLVEFYSGETKILEISTDVLMTLLTTGDPTVGGYTKLHWFGNPKGWTDLPTNNGVCELACSEPYTYLHVFAQGGLTFDRVVFSGGGFEFDNFVVSDLPQSASSAPYTLVPLGSVEGTPPPDFEPPTEGGGYPNIDLDHYTDASELPNTGRDSQRDMLIAAVAVLSGVGVLTARRRMSRA